MQELLLNFEDAVRGMTPLAWKDFLLGKALIKIFDWGFDAGQFMRQHVTNQQYTINVNTITGDTIYTYDPYNGLQNQNFTGNTATPIYNQYEQLQNDQYQNDLYEQLYQQHAFNNAARMAEIYNGLGIGPGMIL